MLVEVDLDDYIGASIGNHIQLLENNSYPVYFYKDREKDKLAVNHLIHCMKVVCDYYTDFDKPKYFDYGEAER